LRAFRLTFLRVAFFLLTTLRRVAFLRVAFFLLTTLRRVAFLRVALRRVALRLAVAMP
jgi:hypothetical protein